MNNNCTHIWCLDHEPYFDRELGLGAHFDNNFKIVFPAKCYVCKEHKTFTKEQWLEHVGEK